VNQGDSTGEQRESFESRGKHVRPHPADHNSDPNATVPNPDSTQDRQKGWAHPAQTQHHRPRRIHRNNCTDAQIENTYQATNRR
ncbi:TPA: hypothetical protein ACRXUP_006367, partial [Pseudomonas aeruginosa]